MSDQPPRDPHAPIPIGEIGSDDPPFRKVEERKIYQGFVISVFNNEFVGPSGEAMNRDVVHHPGAVTVVPVHDDGTVVLVRQYRTAIEDWLIEAPAGKRDVDGEAPELTAHRELREEVGLEAASLEPLIVLKHSPGFCDEHNHIFLATGLTACDRALDGPEEEHMSIVHVPLADVFDHITAGTITDGKTVVGLTLAHRRLLG